MKHTKFYAILTTCLVLGGSWAACAEAPKGWFLAGSHPREYQISVDRETPRSGKASAHLESAVLNTSGFGTLMQQCKAGEFRGKRVRLSGFLRSRNVKDWAGMWMRVDGSRSEALAFDNMQERPIKGTTDWIKYEIVLDVPAEAEQIAFGVLLTGRGDVWLDELKFDTVSKGTPTTAQSTAKAIPDGPMNLDFEQ